MIYTDESYIRNTIFKRPKDAHKGHFGKVLIFAGSSGMAGAAVFCAKAALKSGAGLVQFLLPDFDTPLLPILQTSVPEATCVDYSKGINFSDYTAIAAGSGLGNPAHSHAHMKPDDVRPQKAQCTCDSLNILEDMITTYNKTLVLDADALNMVSCNDDLAEKVRRSSAGIIITPHIGEARRLLHTQDSISGSEARIRAATQLSEKYSCISVLKGAGTLVAKCSSCWTRSQASNYENIAIQLQETKKISRENESAPASRKEDLFEIYENTTGNPGMATAGSGDALAGLICSLAAQGYCPLDAARTGVFIHGKAGDLAALDLGEMGVTTSDIVSNIPYALKPYC